jgi:hypothetical protein
MKKSLLNLFLFACIIHQVNAQRHINLYAGLSYINPTNWNRTIDAFNFSRPWLNNSLPQIRTAKTWGFGTSGVIGKGFFLSPEFSYSRYSSSSENPPVSVAIDVKWVRASMYLDVYPREFKLDSVAYTIRPFFRIGGGASCLLPRVRINNELVNVDDETYKPIIWSYQLSAGVGCRIALTKRIDVSPVVLYHFMPNVNLEDFSYVLHGTQVPDLNDKQKISNLMAMISLSFRLTNDER